MDKNKPLGSQLWEGGISMEEIDGGCLAIGSIEMLARGNIFAKGFVFVTANKAWH